MTSTLAGRALAALLAALFACHAGAAAPSDVLVRAPEQSSPARTGTPNLRASRPNSASRSPRARSACRRRSTICW